MRTAWGGLVLALTLAGTAEARPLRIMSLDQCADQYVLELAPDAELALSPRADDPDAWLRVQGADRRRVRPTLEAAMGFRPDVVVRYWGGEPRLLAAMEKRGVRVVTIDDAVDFDGVRADIRAVAAGLDRPERGEALVRRMDRTLEAAAPKGAGPRPSALYLTPGGFTAGPGSLVDAMMRAAGFDNLAPSGFAPVSVERIALTPPFRFILGFFDRSRADWRGPGRHPVVRRAARGRTVASLPAAVLTCPAWFAADGAALLAKARS